MKKLIILLIGIFMFQFSTFAQEWDQANPNTTQSITRDGKITLGNPIPGSGFVDKLHVRGHLALSGNLRGYATAPGFYVFGKTSQNNGALLRLGGNNGGAKGLVEIQSYDTGNIRFLNRTGGTTTSLMTIQNDGLVGVNGDFSFKGNLIGDSGDNGYFIFGKTNESNGSFLKLHGKTGTVGRVDIRSYGGPGEIRFLNGTNASNDVEQMVIHSNGNIGINSIGESNDTERLNLFGSMQISESIMGYRSGTNESLQIAANTDNQNGAYIKLYGSGSGSRNGDVSVGSHDEGDIIFWNYTTESNWVQKMKIQSDGKVVIGNSATDPASTGYLLSVDQGIMTEKVRVCADASNWCDYVFDEDYDRNSLEEIEAHVKEKKHLPNVPSAQEVEEEGINVAEMDATLLRQIEELWLHMIDLKKENEAIKKELNTLKK